MVLALAYIITGTLTIVSSILRKRLFFVLTLVSCLITIVIAIVIRLKFGADYDRIKQINKRRNYNHGTQMSLTSVNAIFFQGRYFTYKSNTSIYLTSIMASIELIGVLLSLILAAVSFSAACRKKQGNEV